MRQVLDCTGEEGMRRAAPDLIRPLSFSCLAGEGCSISFFPSLAGLAQDFLARYGDAPAREEALAWLAAEMSPYFSTWGYQSDPSARRYVRVLQAKKREINENLPKLSTILLKKGDNYRNLTTLDLRSRDTGLYPAAAVVRDGEIVSAACTHLVRQAAGVAEVGVETAPAARRRGYAAAALARLTQALHERGMTVEYRCYHDNQASYRTARAVGFREVGIFYSLIGRRVR